MTNAPPTDVAQAGDNKMPIIVYVLYLVSFANGLTALIGLVMAYVYQGDAPEWARSHYRFQIRTFWLGLLAAVVGILTLFLFVGWLILLALIVWLIVRCVKGINYASKRMPHPDPAGLLF